MSVSKGLVENDFTDELYNMIYAGIGRFTRESDTNQNHDRLESPQKERFLELFVKLKLKNEPLDTNFVLRVCHRLLEQNESRRASTPCPYDRTSSSSCANTMIIDQCDDENAGCIKSEPSAISFSDEHDNRIVFQRSTSTTTLSTAGNARMMFGQKLLMDLAHCSQGKEWIHPHVYSCLEFMTSYIDEFVRSHNVIKDYVNIDNIYVGRVADALRFVLQNELNSYYINVNIWLRDNVDVLQHPFDNLHKFVPLDYNFLLRMQCLAEIAENARNKNGCNIVSSLIHTRLPDVLNEIAKPIQKMMVRWMTDGEVEDEHDEFFIVVTSSEYYWDRSHSLSSTNRLDFLNTCQTNNIYQMGKNMRFLMKVLGPKINSEIAELRENIKRLADEDGFLIMLTDKYSEISTLLSDACAQSSALLMEVLMNKYDLFSHFAGFRNYMLFGRGDFYSYVISKLDAYFGNNEMRHYQLEDIIENAYQVTSAGNDNKKLFDNLKYRIVCAGEVNWNSFKFEYVTDEPLNQIFGPCLNHYVNIFEFLWRLKNIDWTANKMWHELINFAKKFHYLIKLKPVLRNINSLLSNMLSCMNEIQNFMFETINEEWKRFESETCGATCVKTVTDAHMSFLESITKCADDESASLDEYVDSLKGIVEIFGNIFQRFLGTWETLSENIAFEDASIGDDDEMETFFVDEFKDVKKMYETGLLGFLSQLVNSETRGLGKLASRIDFNGYYSNTSNKNEYKQIIIYL